MNEEPLSKYGIVNDSLGKFIGRYVYFYEQSDQQYFDSLCQSWLDTYERDKDFFIIVDLETNGLFPKRNNILLNAVSWDGNNAVVWSPWSFDQSKYHEVLRTIPIANHNCLNYDTQIITEHGFMKLGQIVEERREVKILTFNTSNPSYQWKPITNWWNNGVKNNWNRITFDAWPYHLIVTSDHELYKYKDEKLIKQQQRKFVIGDNLVLHSPNGLVNIEIKSISKYENPLHKNGYDLEIADNHNYIANNLLVSNCKFDAKFLSWETGIEPTICFDTMIATQLGYAGCFPGIGKKYGLDNVVKHILPGLVLSKAVRSEFIDKEIGSPFTKEQIAYAASDVLTTHRLVYPLKKRLFNENLNHIYETELAVCQMQVQSELDGIKVDLPKVESIYKEKTEQLEVLLEDIRIQIEKFPVKQQPKYKKKERFNPKSPLQVMELMDKCYDYKMTSTDKDGMLKALTECQQPVIKQISEYRLLFDQVHKQIAGFLEDDIWRFDNTLHPTTNVYGAVSGRESQSEPNMQQIQPADRCICIARDGNLIVKSDYSSYEFRACAARTEEPYLIQGFKDRAEQLPVIKRLSETHNYSDYESFVKDVKKGKYKLVTEEYNLVREFDATDIHKRNGALILDKSMYDVTDEDRVISKCVGLETYIHTDTGICKVGDLLPAKRVAGKYYPIKVNVLTDTGYKLAESIYYSGSVPALKVVTASGRKLIVSPAHKFRSVKSDKYAWVRADKLEPGHELFVKTTEKFTDTETADPKIIYYRIAGSIISDYLPEHLTLKGIITKNIAVKNYVDTKSVKLSSKDTGQLITHTGFVGWWSEFVKSPYKYFTTDEQVRAFLSTVFVSNVNMGWIVSSTNLELIRLVQNLCTRIGLAGRVNSINDQHRLQFWGFDLEIVVGIVNDKHKKRVFNIRECRGYAPNHIQTQLHEGIIYCKHLENGVELDSWTYSKKVLSDSDHEFMEMVIANRLRKDSVISVTPVGNVELCDVSVPSNNTVVYESLVTHNTLGYAVLYKGGPGMVQTKLALAGAYHSLDYCQNVIDTFNRKLPLVKQVADETDEAVWRDGYVSTMLGRKLYFDLPPKWRRKEYQTVLIEAQRTANNFLYQGNSVDATKIAKKLIWHEMVGKYELADRPKLILSVHDELVYDTPKPQIPEMSERINRLMILGGNIATCNKVEIECSLSIGEMWKK